MRKAKNNKNRKKRKSRTRLFELLMTIIAFVLTIVFFVGGFWHNKLTSMGLSLHFCNHLLCFFYAVLWFILALIGLYYLLSVNRMHFVWAIVYATILVLGIIFMNIYDCGVGASAGSGDDDLCNYDQVCKAIYGSCLGDGGAMSTALPGEMGSCTDNDGGLVLEIPGTIEETGATDSCLDGNTLVEYECLSDTIYTSYEIDCRIYYWKFPFPCCSMGTCVSDCPGAGGGGGDDGGGGGGGGQY